MDFTISSTTFVETDRSFYSNHVANIYFNYNATWANAHHFNVMVGANIDKDEYEYLYYERHAMQDPNLPELALCNEDYSYEHQHTHNGSAGVFGRINYDYKGIYLFEFNARGDASSKFPSGQQWAFFPSGSIGYCISEEPSFEPARPYVSNLKLRASYGTIGNQEIGDMMFLELMSKNPDGNKVNWMGDGKTTLDWFEQPNMVYPLLTWETIATANVGFDLDLFFQGVGKRDMWTQSSFVMPFMRGVDGIYANQMDYVTQAMVDNNTIDQSAMYPRLYGGNADYGVPGSSVLDAGCNNFYPQDRYLVNMAYLRLKNLTVGYTLPQNLTRKATIEKVRIYASFNNLCDLVNHTAQYGLDPEISTGEGKLVNGTFGRTAPITRSYSFGLQITL